MCRTGRLNSSTHSKTGTRLDYTEKENVPLFDIIPYRQDISFQRSTCAPLNFDPLESRIIIIHGRVIYYWNKAEECIYMLLVFGKSRQEDLTKEQLRTLRKLVKENLK